MIDTGSMSSENVKGILDWIMYLRMKYNRERDDLVAREQNFEAEILAFVIKDLENLQDRIEEDRN